MRPPRRRGRLLPAVYSLLAVAVILAVLVGGTFAYARNQLEAPASDHSQTAIIQVRPGESLSQLADDLAGQGLIKSAFWFGWFARFKGLDSRLQAGRYRLDSGMGASAIIARLEGRPDVATVRLVLTEGMTALQMAQRVGASGIGVTAQQYMNEVQHGSFSQAFLAGRPAGASLEGFLFPDTYDVAVGTSAHDLVGMQLDDFGQRATNLLQSPPNRLTAYQLVVLASLVEREARFDDDRPKVASVIYNRLQRGMDLQIDASVLYGLGITGRSPTPAELQQDTPYNTYLHPGLPPTPIANPGLAALQGAAHPAQTAFLFYVSDACGHNHYSTTDAQHEAQVKQYVNAPCPS